MKSIIIDGIEYVPKENEKDTQPTILKKTLHFEVYCEDLERFNWNDAIELCSKLGDGWRLPTILELQLMYENRKLIGDLKDTAYWSSTEYNAFNAWYFNFNYGLFTPPVEDRKGSTNFTSKYDTNYVRAVRSRVKNRFEF